MNKKRKGGVARPPPYNNPEVNGTTREPDYEKAKEAQPTRKAQASYRTELHSGCRSSKSTTLPPYGG